MNPLPIVHIHIQRGLDKIGQENWFNSDLHWVITYKNELVGSLSAYYEDGDFKRWLDVGIVIYKETTCRPASTQNVDRSFI